MDKTDFIINQKPVSISFDCPHCGIGIELPWDEINTPNYWDEDWEPVKCPACGELVELGNYEIDEVSE